MALYVRWRYLNVPFERDEGEYAYGAQIILQGKELYSNVYSLKWPGIFLIYSIIIGAFGASIWAVHCGLLIVNLVTAYVIYRILSRVTTNLPALIGAVSFLIFMVQKEVQGIFANIEHFVVFFIALAIYKLIVYWHSDQRRDLLLIGIFCGIALITKQQAIGFVLAITASILFKYQNYRRDWRDLLAQTFLFGLGVIIPVVIVFIWIALFDNFQRFWFHTWVYATEYVGIVSLEDGWFELRKRIIENFTVNPWLWGSAVMGGLFICKSRIKSPIRFLLIALFMGAFVATSFGLYYRPHYVMFMSLALSLLSGVFFDLLYRIRSWMSVGLFTIAIIYYGYNDWTYLFRWSPEQAVSKIYHWEPFVATLTIGSYLKEHVHPNDEIMILGSDPQINFYANRNTPTGYVYAYPIVEDQRYALQMADEWVSDLDRSRPEYIVVMGAWIPYISDNPGFRKIWDGTQQNIKQGYSLIGNIEVTEDNMSRATWGENLQIPVDNSRYLFVYKRNP